MSEKNPHAVALGRLGGRTMTEKRRAHLARIAGLGAAARWGKTTKRVVKGLVLAVGLITVFAPVAEAGGLRVTQSPADSYYDGWRAGFRAGGPRYDYGYGWYYSAAPTGTYTLGTMGPGTTCTKGTVEEVPEQERTLWHDGAIYGPAYAGYRCITAR